MGIRCLKLGSLRRSPKVQNAKLKWIIRFSTGHQVDPEFPVLD
jgi:hypothetical protein